MFATVRRRIKVNNVIVNYNLFLVIYSILFFLYALLGSVTVDRRHQLDSDFPTHINTPYVSSTDVRYTTTVPISS